jgi:hypothetical protein
MEEIFGIGIGMVRSAFSVILSRDYNPLFTVILGGFRTRSYIVDRDGRPT